MIEIAECSCHHSSIVHAGTLTTNKKMCMDGKTLESFHQCPLGVSTIEDAESEWCRNWSLSGGLWLGGSCSKHVLWIFNALCCICRKSLPAIYIVLLLITAPWKTRSLACGSVLYLPAANEINCSTVFLWINYCWGIIYFHQKNYHVKVVNRPSCYAVYQVLYTEIKDEGKFERVTLKPSTFWLALTLCWVFHTLTFKLVPFQTFCH